MDYNISVSFVIPISDENIFTNNLFSSPLIINNNYKNIEVIQQRGYKSASKAYNEGIDISKNDIIVCAHQDMIFPEFWLNELNRFIIYLNEADPNWGVLGCYGVDKHGKGYGYLYCTGNKKLFGNLMELPVQVQTLDEVVLIFRKSSGLRFDNDFPHFHLYGADICLSAAKNDMKCYAISAFSLHNTNKLRYLPDEYFDCLNYIKNKWHDYLPVYTSCVSVQRYNFLTYFRYRYVRRYKYSLRKLFNYEYNIESTRSEKPISMLLEMQKVHRLKYEDD
jgi:hypothetical protein